MYTPPAFREDDTDVLHGLIRSAGLSNLVTATAGGLMATPLPLFIEAGEGAHGTLYGHLARANPQWTTAPIGDAMAIFSGPEAYISPAWYASKQEHGKVVPTWNYVAVHAYGPVEFFDDAARLHAVVSRLTTIHEAGRPYAWAVTDAPDAFIAAQLKGIVGLRMPITRLEGKRKLSQNRSAADREGVAVGLAESARADDREMAKLIPRD